MILSQIQIEVLAVFIAVYALIIFRRIGRFKVEVWVSMLVGAVALIAVGAMGLDEAFEAVNSDVLLFLFGTFLIVGVMIQVGLLQHLAVRVLRIAKTPSRLLAATIVFVSVASAFLVNDAVVLVMTPIVLLVCRTARIREVPYVIAVALSSNIGSALTPIGNPQNVLIKIESGINTLYFMREMAIPVALGMLVEYSILKRVYRRVMQGSFSFSFPSLPPSQSPPSFPSAPSSPSQSPASGASGDFVQEQGGALTSRAAARMVGVVVLAVTVGFLASDLTGWPIALTAALGGTAALAISSDRRGALRGIDWGTMVFFASMFVVMRAVESSGLLAAFIEPFRSSLFSDGSSSLLSIFGLSIVLSQITSNVPFVAAMLPVFRAAGATSGQWLALAAGSTLAGNLTLLGAAANIIVLEAAESRGSGFSFVEFFKVGMPVALVTSGIAVVSLIALG